MGQVPLNNENVQFERKHIGDLPAEDPLVAIGKKTEDMFTFLVDTLRNPETFPDPVINKLMRLTWSLVGHNVYSAAVGDVPTLTFFYKLQNTHEEGAFICPKNWADECVTNRFYHMGGLVWASSQARDAWYGKMVRESKEKIMDRASLYEAHFLLVLANHEDFKPNKYQKELMEKFPKGLESCPELKYN